MKKVSVVIPVYRVERYLARCVDSVLAQTCKDMEVILVDDGSPDSCGAMCDIYAEKHPHISVIHKTNGGLSSARLAGFRQAAGEYILFIDSDDYIMPDMVSTLLTAIESNGADMAMCSYYVDRGGVLTEHIISSPSPVIGSVSIEKDYIRKLIGSAPHEENIPAFLWLRMMKRSLIQEHYFVDENTCFSEDLVFDLEYAQAVSSIAITTKPLYVYSVHSGSLTMSYRRDSWKMSLNLFQYMLQYERSHQLSIPEIRKANYLCLCVIRAINNALLLKDYTAVRREMDLICLDETVSKYLHLFAQTNLSFPNKIILLLTRIRVYWLVYLLKRVCG